jgi:hypothetical protein
LGKLLKAKAEKNRNKGAVGVILKIAARTPDLNTLYSSAEGLMFSEHYVFVPKSA